MNPTPCTTANTSWLNMYRPYTTSRKSTYLTLRHSFLFLISTCSYTHMLTPSLHSSCLQTLLSPYYILLYYTHFSFYQLLLHTSIIGNPSLQLAHSYFVTASPCLIVDIKTGWTFPPKYFLPSCTLTALPLMTFIWQQCASLSTQVSLHLFFQFPHEYCKSWDT